MNAHTRIERRRARPVDVAGVTFGGGSHVVVQSMTRADPAAWDGLDAGLLARRPDGGTAAAMREALVEAALGSARRARASGLAGDRVVLSCERKTIAVKAIA